VKSPTVTDSEWVSGRYAVA